MLNFKKYILYLFLFVLVIFIIPIMCTKKIKETSVGTDEATNQNIDDSKNKYDYSKYANIKLLHKSNMQIEEVPLDEYLYGVVAAEMPADYEIEALKAQAIAARTYTIYQIEKNKEKHAGADMCDEANCCQAWISKEERMKKWEENEKEKNWSKIKLAVDSTAGKIITYDNKPINAFFHSNSGGITETNSNVWSGAELPYLQSVETAGEEGYKQYSSEVKVSKDDVIKKLKEENADFSISFEDKECIKILEYTQSGRVKTVKFGNVELAGTRVRSLFDLKSTNFSIRIDTNEIVFSVKGNGHGVGMSQTGANSMAKEGKSCEDIIKHFYTGVEVEEI